MVGKELFYIAQAHFSGKLAGDGPYTSFCHDWLESTIGVKKALLTHSGTAALEMAAMLLDLEAGDEVIMPSYTFVSTANAFVLRGAIPVFVDIRPDNLNINEELIEAAITSKTRAIVLVHYAGVSCDMDKIMAIANRYNLVVIEDAAQAILSKYKDRALGSIGHMGCLSFHETKNIISGEGGALLVNDEKYVQRAEIIREKGTNRSQFFRGQVDKYTWCDIGSSYLPGEIIAAFLYAQTQSAQEITNQRLAIWNTYHTGFEKIERSRLIRRPKIALDCEQNGHMYYLIMRNLSERTDYIEHMKKNGISTVFHYVPLHSSKAGIQYGRVSGDMSVTNDLSERLVRLPLWIGVEEHQSKIIESTINYLT